MAVKQKKHVSDFTLRLGPVQSRGSLYSIQKPKPKSGTHKYVSPDGRDVRQVYIPADAAKAEEFWTTGELELATKDDESTLVGKNNVAAAKASVLPLNVIDLTVHEADEVDRQLFPSEHNAYVFMPDEKDPANVSWYTFLRDVLDGSDRAFVGLCNLKNVEALYRIVLWKGCIVIQRQLYPESINEIESYEPEAGFSNEQIAKGIAQVAKTSEPFNPTDYTNATHAKLVALNQAASAGEVEVAKVIAAAPQPVVDFDAVLAGFDD
jgi:hypothetical protein